MARQFLRIIDEQADHIRFLINDLVDMTQIDSGTLSVTPEPTNLAPGLPRVMADKQRIFQVLNNLLTNASEYSLESSAIRVRVSQEDVYVAVSVEYEGRGGPAEVDSHFKCNRLSKNISAGVL